jgi:hypothetical protein
LGPARVFAEAETQCRATAAFVVLWRLVGSVKRTEEIKEFMRMSVEAGAHPEIVRQAVNEIAARPAEDDGKCLPMWPISVWLPEISGNVVVVPLS